MPNTARTLGSGSTPNPLHPPCGMPRSQGTLDHVIDKHARSRIVEPQRYQPAFARMVELADTTDLKSVDRKVVRVQIPLRVPEITLKMLGFHLWGWKMVGNHGLVFACFVGSSLLSTWFVIPAFFSRLASSGRLSAVRYPQKRVSCLDTCIQQTTATQWLSVSVIRPTEPERTGKSHEVS